MPRWSEQQYPDIWHKTQRVSTPLTTCNTLSWMSRRGLSPITTINVILIRTQRMLPQFLQLQMNRLENSGSLSLVATAQSSQSQKGNNQKQHEHPYRNGRTRVLCPNFHSTIQIMAKMKNACGARVLGATLKTTRQRRMFCVLYYDEQIQLRRLC